MNESSKNTCMIVHLYQFPNPTIFAENEVLAMINSVCCDFARLVNTQSTVKCGTLFLRDVARCGGYSRIIGCRRISISS